MRKSLGVIVAAALTLAFSPARGADTPSPQSVTVAGSLQSELGCPGYWQSDGLRSWLHAGGTRVGLPSDDSQLTFWTLESLLDRGSLDPEDLAARFASRRIFGIGKSVQQFLHHREQGITPWYRCGAESAGNGELMRIAPITLLHPDGTGSGLYAMDVERRAVHAVSFGLEEYLSIDASADGRRLAATVAKPDRNLWTVAISDRVAGEAEARRFEVPSVRAAAPRFGPDYVLYLSSRGGPNGLWMFKDGVETLTTDVMEFCAREMPRFYPFNIRGVLMREAGATMAQEAGFAFSNAIAYIQSALERGLPIDAFAPRISFFFSTGTQIFEEAARYRAARRLWARIMKERFGARVPSSMLFRFTGTVGGSAYRAQEPENNLIRGAYGLLANVLGGVQGMLHPAMDEPFAIPTEETARLALRTQQICAFDARWRPTNFSTRLHTSSSPRSHRHTPCSLAHTASTRTWPAGPKRTCVLSPNGPEKRAARFQLPARQIATSPPLQARYRPTAL